VKQLPHIALEFREGTSDKVYRASIDETDGGYVVNFGYGRRGATLNTGTKTTYPVTYVEAEAIYEKLVKSKTAKGYRPVYGVDPFTVIRWVRQCHRVYVLLHRQAFNRLGRTKCTDWHKPDMTYRQALLTFTRNERKMRECVKKCFKLNTKMWAWLFGWAKAEQLRLRLRRKAPADVHRLPAKAA